MLMLLSAVETPPDPIWLRTLATVLPVVGTVLVALVAAPWLVGKYRGRGGQGGEPTPAEPMGSPPALGIPSPVSIAATERAALDPVIRLFIEDLHERLSAAHQEAAELHTLRAGDAATIARLTAELADKEVRLRDLEEEYETTKVQANHFRSRLEQLKQELEMTQRKLAICVEGYTQR